MDNTGGIHGPDDAIIDSLLPEFDREMGWHTPALDRVPDGKFDWKAPPPSVTLGQLANILTDMPQ